MRIPSYRNRSPIEIAGEKRLFDSAWHFWQALSWLDYAKRETSVAALQYGAIELRLGIEHLWFDIIVTAVGGDLDIRDYSACKDKSTRMYKVLDRLSPDHTKLVRFSKIVGSVETNQPPLIEWDISRLKRLHSDTSHYLHFLGIPAESIEKLEWFVETLTLLENGANYVWDNLTTARSGQINIASMPPEVRDAWEGFRSGNLDEEAVRIRLSLAKPILHMRRRRL